MTTSNYQCKNPEAEESAELQQKGEEFMNVYNVGGPRDSVAGSQDILSEAISLFRKAAQLRPPGHPERAGTLLSLAKALRRDFIRGGDPDGCAKSIIIVCEVLDICRKEHPLHIDATIEYVCALIALHEQDSQKRYLEEALVLARRDLSTCPLDHPRRFTALGCQADVIAAYGYETGNADFFEEAILLHRECLQIIPPDHPSRPTEYNSAALTLLANYDHTMNLEYLEEAIMLLRNALAACMTTKKTQTYLVCLHNLSIALHKQFMRDGNMDTLEEAIQMDRDALQLLDANNPHRGTYLGYLAEKLLVSFDQNGGFEVLLEAIEFQREALRLIFNNDKERNGRLMILAQALERHWEAEHNIASLEEAIDIYREVLRARSEGHIDHTKGLSSLGNALSTYAKVLRDGPLLNDAIKLHRAAERLLPSNAVNRSELLTYLALTLSAQFELNKEEKLVAEAISLHHKALNLRIEGHPLRHASHHFLARLLLLESSQRHEELALDHISSANVELGSLARKRLHMMIESLPHIERSLRHGAQDETRFEKALNVYVQAIQLLPRTAHLGLDLPSRLRELAGSEDLCRTAACRALLLQRDSLAVEIIEKGKNAFWSQCLNLRSKTMDLLPSEDRKTLSNLFSLLEESNQRVQEKASSRAELEIMANKQRQLNLKAEQLIDDIRSRPGFERFLDTPSFPELAHAAVSGPIVILFGTEIAYFALILIDTIGTTRSIRLSNVTAKELQKLNLQVLQSGLRDASYDLASQDTATSSRLTLTKQHNVGLNGEDPYVVLNEIWNMVVLPVVSALNLTRAHGRSRTRIHWCPSGEFAFLPLHAAGIYRGTRRICASDFMVSSYTPSLSTLLRVKSHQGPQSIPWSNVNSLLVSAPHVPDLPPLLKADEEVQHVVNLVRIHSNTSNGDLGGISTETLVKPVMDKLPSSHILHLACHGRQHKNPLESHFALTDGPLSIEALMGLNLPNAMLAFLSACDTAKGDRNQPDQAVHLAASLLFCGFKSVIGTMWSMGDIDGPAVASQVYEEILKKDVLDLDDIPYAVDKAVTLLREKGVPPSRWATFIHIGA